MKNLADKKLLIFSIFLGLFFYSCDKDNGPIDGGKPKCGEVDSEIDLLSTILQFAY